MHKKFQQAAKEKSTENTCAFNQINHETQTLTIVRSGQENLGNSSHNL